jgi:hypothetical protein
MKSPLSERGNEPKTSGVSTSFQQVEDRDRPSAIVVVVARLGLVWLVLLVVGFYGGALGWRGGAFVMLAGVCGNVAGHLLMGITEYRRIMGRPWPKVRPLEDDDEW